jgi:hypothetical protein
LELGRLSEENGLWTLDGLVSMRLSVTYVKYIKGCSDRKCFYRLFRKFVSSLRPSGESGKFPSKSCIAIDPFNSKLLLAFMTVTKPLQAHKFDARYQLPFLPRKMESSAAIEGAFRVTRLYALLRTDNSSHLMYVVFVAYL